MSSHILRTLAAAALLWKSAALHGAEPFDFDYVISGPGTARPILVFNDGRETWIQPRQGTEVTVLDTPSERRGPYIVLRGTPPLFALNAAGTIVTVAKTSAVRESAAFMTARLAQDGAGCDDRHVSVPFPRLRSVPNQLTNRAIKEAARLASGARRVVVIGHPDHRSERFARARAAVVSKALIQHNVPASAIETRWETTAKPGTEVEVIISPSCPYPARSTPQPSTPTVAPAIHGPGKNPAQIPVQAKAAVMPQEEAESQQRAEPKPEEPQDNKPVAIRTESGAAAAPAQDEPGSRAGKQPPSRLVVRAGERLSQALKAFLAERGIGLEWLASTDIEATRDTRIEFADWKHTVAFAASSGGYSAVFIKDTNTVQVRDASKK